MTFTPNRQTLAVLSCFFPLAALAQTTNTVPRLEQVVVTASRTTQLQKDVIGDVTVIGKDELQKAGQNSVAEILARHRGVQFADQGGPQTPTSVFLRGNEGRHTLVLVDGIRVSKPYLGGANWNAIDPAIIERIEIVRGAASSIYGSDAIGGVVNIITKKTGEDRPLSVWGNIGLGSYGTFKSSAGVSGAQDGWDYALSSSMAESSGFSTSYRTPDSFTYNGDEDGYRQHALSGSLGYRWSAGHHIGLTAYNGYTNGDYDNGAYGDPAVALTRQQAYSVTSTDTITDYWESVLRFGFSKEMYDDRGPFAAKFGSLQRSYTWQNNVKLTKNQTVSLILERMEERLATTGDYAVSQRNTNAAGLVYRGDFGAHHVQANVRNDNISGYGNEATGGLAYDLDLNDQWRVGIAGNTGFQAPGFDYLYSPWGGNPDLKPELSRNIEASLRYDNGSTRLGMTVFQNKIKDLIASAPPDYIPQNIARATIRGVTLTAEHDVGNTTLRAGTDFMSPRDDATGNQLPRRAKQVYRLGADHRIDALTLGAEYQFTGKRYDDVVNTKEKAMGGYGLLNLTAGYDFTKNVGVQVRWNNLFDKDYINAYGYNTPGSNVFVNLSVRM